MTEKLDYTIITTDLEDFQYIWIYFLKIFFLEKACISKNLFVSLLE